MHETQTKARILKKNYLLSSVPIEDFQVFKMFLKTQMEIFQFKIKITFSFKFHHCLSYQTALVGLEVVSEESKGLWGEILHVFFSRMGQRGNLKIKVILILN